MEGAEYTPKCWSWADTGMFIEGPEFREMTRVAWRVVEPVESLAVNPIVTPVTKSDPASLAEGVPVSVWVLLSNESQPGP